MQAPFRVVVYSSDLALHLTVRPGHSVTVLGYLGERLFRLGPAGLAVNERSPSAASAGLLARGSVPGASSVTWHDGRVSRLRPGAASERWRIPIVVDGHLSQIAGTVRRLRAPALWPWLLLSALLAGSAFVRGSAIPLGAVAGGAGIVLTAAFAVDSYASPGTWIAALDETVFAAVGAGALWLAPRIGRVAAGGGLGLLAVAVGLSKGELFLHPAVLAALPGAICRLLASVAIGAGTGAAVAAAVWFCSPRLQLAARLG